MRQLWRFVSSPTELHRMVPFPKGLVALDVGTRKTGISVADGTLQHALPYGLVTHNHLGTGLGAKDHSMLRSVLRARRPCALIVGSPLELSGRKGSQHERMLAIVTRWLAELGCSPDIPVLLKDERFSSAYVDRYMPNEQKRVAQDSLVAALLLQEYLDFRRAEERLR